MRLATASGVSDRSGVMTPRKRILILVLIVVLIAAIGVYGIQIVTSEKQVVPVISAAMWYQFKLEVEVNKAEFGVGEPVEVKVSLTNIGNETAELIFSTKNQKVMFTILDMNGTEVFGTHFSSLIATERISLEPNQQMSETTTWMQNSMFETYSYTDQIPAGNYTIIGKTGSFYLRDYTSPSTWIEAQPIAITIK